ncbi:efflux transporter periplasmic adaptor subunit [Alcaligenes faecalis]|uniref:efflux RND transporter periplasmic adaptor subunit n=1 Tax=Alcaligenes faecalis TaxID=511 RepID=UPI000A2E2940|nr:efflux RND transporter periplasmic adaptor subunit [Alcaligenes faecalis]KAA1286348.1 efflux RND transporter periplasmic adaptor subunit [Alcaligenes faecalis]OSZ32873.1 efflux transporter periplasmic adaptor subunit [Alcaligenes faecalis]OSZ44989.1 efflux transporter periplasmic adaptor subunit [Alcaligenes faecalis]
MKSKAVKRRWALALVAVLVLGALAAQAGRSSEQFETVAVEQSDIRATVAAVGTLKPSRYVDVGAQVSGQITALPVAPGDQVEQGQLLVEIDPSVQQATVDAGRASLAAFRAQLAEQQAQLLLARQQLTRQRQLERQQASRQEDIQIAQANLATAQARVAHVQAQMEQTQATLKADEARLGYTRIYAPMSGTVIGVQAREGQTLNATYQTPNILRIADLSTMTVWTSVSEADIRRIKPGMTVTFTTLGEQGETQARQWQAKVRQIMPAPEGSTQEETTTTAPTATQAIMYTVLFDVDNEDGELMPQMTAQVLFEIDRADQALLVPLVALRPDPQRGPDAFKVPVLEQGKLQEKPVSLGVRNRHQVQVLGGLAKGEQVVLAVVAAERGWRWLQW